jgi:FkbM family methyltransferase
MRELLSDARRFRRAFRNYPTAIWRAARHRYPFEAILRDGSRILLTDGVLAYHLSTYAERGWHYDSDTDVLSLPESVLGRPVRFHGAGHDGDVAGIAGGELARLTVRNRTVLDIGANIGDSPIYFALNGARRVIALEPYPRVCSIAQANVRMNGFEGIIEVHQMGCAGVDGSVTLNPDVQSTGRSGLLPSTEGMSLRLVSLPTLVREFHIEDGSILKIDCEGCEYGVISRVGAETLRKFQQIQIEYHYGVQDLSERLRSAGFRVSVSEQRIATCPGGISMDAGLIFATSSG